MRALFEITRVGISSFFRYPLSHLATGVCVLAAVFPFLVGLGISRGIQAEAIVAVREGANLYASGMQLGQRTALPQQLHGSLAQIEGVTAVVPRIVGSVELGKNRESAVLVGLPLQYFPASIQCIEGKLPQTDAHNELVLGIDLARRLRLNVGSRVPPFYHNDRGERLSQVVGVFRSDVSLWQANLILTSLETAGEILDQPDRVTDFLIYCRPGVEGSVRQAILQKSWRSPGIDDTGIRMVVTSREDLEILLPRGILHREGIFNLHFVLMFIAIICSVLISAGPGNVERRREIGILKATGWQTDEVLLRSLVEGFCLSMACACAAIVLAYFWMKVLNGYWIASVFLGGVDKTPSFQVPFRLFPGPGRIAFLISVACAMTGNLYSTWRVATTSPMTAMR